MALSDCDCVDYDYEYTDGNNSSKKMEIKNWQFSGDEEDDDGNDSIDNSEMNR